MDIRQITDTHRTIDDIARGFRQTRDQIRSRQYIAIDLNLVKAWMRVIEDQLSWADHEDAQSPKPTSSAPAMLQAEANVAVRKYLETHDDHQKITIRQLADDIGCSTGLAGKTPAWMALMEKRKNEQKPKVVGLPEALQASIDAGGQRVRPDRHWQSPDLAAKESNDRELDRLIAEQNADHEPSPCDEDPTDTRPRKVISHPAL